MFGYDVSGKNLAMSPTGVAVRIEARFYRSCSFAPIIQLFCYEVSDGSSPAKLVLLQ